MGQHAAHSLRGTPTLGPLTWLLIKNLTSPRHPGDRRVLLAMARPGAAPRRRPATSPAAASAPAPACGLRAAGCGLQSLAEPSLPEQRSSRAEHAQCAQRGAAGSSLQRGGAGRAARPGAVDRPAGEGPGRGGRPLGQRGPEARPGAQLPSGRLPWAVVREPRQSRARVSGEGPEIPPCGVRNPALARDSDLPRAGPR